MEFFSCSCNLINGSYIAEGSIFELTGDDVPKTTEVVFIVEASSCNHNLVGNKNIVTIVGALEKAFTDAGIVKSR